MSAVPLKLCTQCKIVKPINCFYRNKGNADGLLNRCIPCHRGAVDSRPRAKREDREFVESFAEYRRVCAKEDARASRVNEDAFARLRSHRSEAQA